MPGGTCSVPGVCSGSPKAGQPLCPAQAPQREQLAPFLIYTILFNPVPTLETEVFPQSWVPAELHTSAPWFYVGKIKGKQRALVFCVIFKTKGCDQGTSESLLSP